MTPLEYFRLLASEFAATDDATVNQWLTVAALFVSAACLDAERQNMALALYAAHLLSTSQKTAAGGGSIQGPLLSEKEGDLQRTYGQIKGSDSPIGQTSYGQQYAELVKPCSGAGIMTRVKA